MDPTQITAMQQRLELLEEFVTQAQQTTQSPSAQHQHQTFAEFMDEERETATSTLHSLPTRPTYAWSPTEFLTNSLMLNSPLFPVEPLLTDDERSQTIEQYPNIEGLHYQPPDTIPLAAQKMNRFQSKQDMSLKGLQYYLSGVFRPLDVLGLELSQNDDNSNTERYLYMLKDCRKLLLNVSAQINSMRNNIALQAVNLGFKLNTPSTTNYTMPLDVFQAQLVQQTTTAQAMKNAGGIRNKKRTFNSNSSNQQANQQQFFRSGPSSQQGGYNNNSSGNNNSPFGSRNNSNNNNYQPRNGNSNNNNKQRISSNNPYHNKRQ